MLIILFVVGATASALLVNRQKRIETFHEMSQVHRRLHNHEFTLWKLRMQIAGRCRPTQVRLLVDRVGGEWQPIPAPGTPWMPPKKDVQLASGKSSKATKPPVKSGTKASTQARTPPANQTPTRSRGSSG
jgi:hypothetical protein